MGVFAFRTHLMPFNYNLFVYPISTSAAVYDVIVGIFNRENASNQTAHWFNSNRPSFYSFFLSPSPLSPLSLFLPLCKYEAIRHVRVCEKYIAHFIFNVDESHEFDHFSTYCCDFLCWSCCIFHVVFFFFLVLTFRFLSIDKIRPLIEYNAPFPVYCFHQCVNAFFWLQHTRRQGTRHRQRQDENVYAKCWYDMINIYHWIVSYWHREASIDIKMIYPFRMKSNWKRRFRRENNKIHSIRIVLCSLLFAYSVKEGVDSATLYSCILAVVIMSSWHV